MRNIGQGTIGKRILLSAGKKFMAFPSVSNGILLMNITNIVNRLQKRQLNRSMSDY